MLDVLNQEPKMGNIKEAQKKGGKNVFDVYILFQGIPQSFMDDFLNVGLFISLWISLFFIPRRRKKEIEGGGRIFIWNLFDADPLHR